MKKLSQILKESQGKRKQAIGYLTVDANGDRGNDNPIDSYCALGAIGCELGVITSNRGSKYLEIKSKIQKELGINIYGTNITCPTCARVLNVENGIIHMNDVEKMSFLEIGIVLEAQGL